MLSVVLRSIDLSFEWQHVIEDSQLPTQYVNK